MAAVFTFCSLVLPPAANFSPRQRARIRFVFVFSGGLLHLVCPESRRNPLQNSWLCSCPLPTEVGIEDSGHGQFDVKREHQKMLFLNVCNAHYMLEGVEIGKDWSSNCHLRSECPSQLSMSSTLATSIKDAGSLEVSHCSGNIFRRDSCN